MFISNYKSTVSTSDRTIYVSKVLLLIIMFHRLKIGLSRHKWLMVLLPLSLISLVYLFLPGQPPTKSTLPSALSQGLQLLYISPPEGDQVTVWGNFALELKFNQPVNPDSLVFTITPSIDLKITPSSDKQLIYLSPSSDWKKNTVYRLKVSSIKSLTDELLTSETIHEFRVLDSTTHEVIISGE
jgi:hypothetical protein